MINAFQIERLKIKFIFICIVIYCLYFNKEIRYWGLYYNSVHYLN